MQFRSTIVVPPEHRMSLFQDLLQASGYTEGTTDSEILSDWYHWANNPRADGSLVYIQPESSGWDFDHVLASREQAYPQKWLEVCRLLAPYTPEGSFLAWEDGNGAYYRFLFSQKMVVYQVGEIFYRDQSLSEQAQRRGMKKTKLSFGRPR